MWGIRRDDGAQSRSPSLSRRRRDPPRPVTGRAARDHPGHRPSRGDASGASAACPRTAAHREPDHPGTHRALINLKNLRVLRWIDDPIPGLAWRHVPGTPRRIAGSIPTMKQQLKNCRRASAAATPRRPFAWPQPTATGCRSAFWPTSSCSTSTRPLDCSPCGRSRSSTIIAMARFGRATGTGSRLPRSNPHRDSPRFGSRLCQLPPESCGQAANDRAAKQLEYGRTLPVLRSVAATYERQHNLVHQDTERLREKHQRCLVWCSEHLSRLPPTQGGLRHVHPHRQLPEAEPSPAPEPTQIRYLINGLQQLRQLDVQHRCNASKDLRPRRRRPKFPTRDPLAPGHANQTGQLVLGQTRAQARGAQGCRIQPARFGAHHQAP